MPDGSAAPGYRLRPADRFFKGGDYSNIVPGGFAPKTCCNISSITCPNCGWWAHWSIWYPTVDCSIFSSIGKEDSRFLVPLLGNNEEEFTPETFAAFAEKWAHLLGSKRPLAPGTTFGIRPAWVLYAVDEFGWCGRGTLYVRESVFEAMVDAGFAVTGVSIPYRAKRDLGEKLIHLELPPLARISAGSGGSICELCGKYTPGEATIIDGSTFDESVPFQRIFEMPEILVVTADFAEFLRGRKTSDVTIDPIDFE